MAVSGTRYNQVITPVSIATADERATLGMLIIGLLSSRWSSISTCGLLLSALYSCSRIPRHYVPLMLITSSFTSFFTSFPPPLYCSLPPTPVCALLSMHVLFIDTCFVKLLFWRVASMLDLYLEGQSWCTSN